MQKTNLIGRRFGRLVVIAEAPSKKSPCGSGRTYWTCQCDCGNVVVVGKTHLLYGDSTSCGCFRKEVSSSRARRHGETKTRLHNVWCGMKERCSPYGAEPEAYYNKGIRVCDEWANSYEAFRDWALANGYDPNAPRGTTTLDRIDNDKGYSPENCRIISQTENARNKPATYKDTINGVTKPRPEWCEIYGADPRLVGERMRRGWDIVDALTKPPRKLTRRITNG